MKIKGKMLISLLMCVCVSLTFSCSVFARTQVSPTITGIQYSQIFEGRDHYWLGRFSVTLTGTGLTGNEFSLDGIVDIPVVSDERACFINDEEFLDLGWDFIVGYSQFAEIYVNGVPTGFIVEFFPYIGAPGEYVFDVPVQP